MEYNALSYSIVAAWAAPLTEVPILEARFANDLFDDPGLTTTGISEGGMTVLKTGRPIVATAAVGPLTLLVRSPELDECLSAFERLREYIITWASKRAWDPNAQAIGWNTEHEWINLGEPGTALLGRFLKLGDFPAEDEVVTAQLLQLTLTVHGSDDKLQVKLEPRATAEKGVFASVNSHRTWSGPLPQAEDARRRLVEEAGAARERLEKLWEGTA